MIDPKELRIGNWVESYYFTMGFGDGKDGERSLGHKQMTGEWIAIIEKSKIAEGQYLATCNPIALTPEILYKCGFDGEWAIGGGYLHFSNGKYWTLTCDPYYTDKNNLKGKFVFEFADNEFGFQESGVPEIKYLHQLQNLHYALTNTELVYNP